MVHLSRRAALAGAGGAAAVSLAGCIDDFIGGGTPDFVQYVPAEAGESESLFLVHVNFDQAEEELPEEALGEFNRDTLLQGTPLSDAGIDGSDIAGAVVIGSGMMSIDYITYGSFDTGAIEDAIGEQSSSEPEDYNGYSVYESRLAISDEVLIVSQDYESYVDVIEGDADQLGAGEGTWGNFLGQLGGGPLTIISKDSNSGTEGLQQYGIVVTGGDSEMIDMKIVAAFESEESANNATDGDELSSDLKGDIGDDSMTVNSVSVDGVFVTVEAETPTADF
ncbi:MAG: hypothetical protein U5K37_00135 [Natrialbaceae archaeon]|nr:hypothetical protein [Natrialbaceae archaeon]